MDDLSLGSRELEVMALLWQHGSGTVAEIQERLDAGLAYTTVLTILRNLEAKGLVVREREGRGHRYAAKVKQRAVQRSALSRVIAGLFAGKPEALVAHLVDEHDLDPEELKALAARIAAPRTRRSS